MGSKNAGATNVFRVAGKKAAAVVFAADFLKGFLAVTFAKCLIFFFNAPFECIFVSGFFAQFGHCFPVFFGFKGGKGVATAAGCAMAIMPLTTVILLTVYALMLKISKTVSVASGVAAAIYPLSAYIFAPKERETYFLFAASCSVLILIMHLTNFRRLISGEEKPLSKK